LLDRGTSPRQRKPELKLPQWNWDRFPVHPVGVADDWRRLRQRTSSAIRTTRQFFSRLSSNSLLIWFRPASQLPVRKNTTRQIAFRYYGNGAAWSIEKYSIKNDLAGYRFGSTGTFIL
jgi:hypothetical protein